MSSPTRVPDLAAAAWLVAPPTQAVFHAIAAGGFEVRAVGGAVRNTLLSLSVADIDLATTARPEDVMRLAKAAGLGTVATGLAHGTVTVIAGHHAFEITTLRRDVETHGRHATVAFTDDWAADARRRDFTMNALYCAADGTLFDPLGGRDDLLARRVRFIGDAGERIREDYLRILRFFRFAAQYASGPLDAGGLAACVREREGLRCLSAERVRQELMRLLVATGVLAVVEVMRTHGLLAEVLPAAPRPALLARLIAIETSRATAPDAASRLAALAVETPEDAARLAQRLRLSGEERDVLVQATRAEAHLSAPPDPPAARALLYRHDPSVYQRLLTLALARHLATPVDASEWSDALSLPNHWTAPVFPIKGADLIAHGIPAGPRIGETLRTLENWWIGQDFAPDRAALLARL